MKLQDQDTLIPQTFSSVKSNLNQQHPCALFKGSQLSKQKLQNQQAHINILEAASSCSPSPPEIDQLSLEVGSQPAEDHIVPLESLPLKYFADNPNLNLEKLCLNLPFERNCLRCDFGKLQSFYASPAHENQNTEFSLGMQGDLLRAQMRFRGRVFVLMNLIWLSLVVLSYSQSTSWFELNTLDKLSKNILKTAAGVSIAEIVLCGILLMLSIHSVVNFSLRALRIYFYGVLTVIVLEFVVNLLLVSFVPIALIKAFILVLFHTVFLFASKILLNAMQSFLVNFLPLIYNEHLMNLSKMYNWNSNTNNNNNNYNPQTNKNLPPPNSQVEPKDNNIETNQLNPLVHPQECQPVQQTQKDLIQV